MRKYLPLLLFIGLAWGQEYSLNDIFEMDNGLFTEKFSDEPITGKVYNYFGKKVYIGNLLNGQKEGKWVWYWENGKKKQHYNFKNGNFHGQVSNWYENGQKENELHYKNGLLEGSVIFWHKNGNKKAEGVWKNNLKNGLITEWYDNGNKQFEANYKNGKKLDVIGNWDENGSPIVINSPLKDKKILKKNVFSSKEYNILDLVESDIMLGENEGFFAIYTYKYDSKPLTGKVYRYFGKEHNYIKKYLGELVNGLKEGQWNDFYPITGQKKEQNIFKKGEEYPPTYSWYENGKMSYEMTPLGEQEINIRERRNIVRTWYENGPFWLLMTTY